MTTFLSAGVNFSEFNLTTIVPSVSTSVGAIAGVFQWGPVNQPVLITSENSGGSSLYSTFGAPNSNNADTWFTAANFLSYSQAEYVCRAANTTSANLAQAALNAFGNTGTVANTPTVLNNNDFDAKKGTFDPDVTYIAKWPGTPGNSLRVSQCDSVNAYSSNLAMTATVNTFSCNASLAVNVGSTVVSINVTCSNPNTANAYAETLATDIGVNDYLIIGNSTIGTQYCQVVNVSAVATGAFTVNIVESFRLSTNFIANSTSTNTVQRVWEFFNAVGSVPTTSTYQANFGNANAVDTMSVVVVDENGYFSGQPGLILETFVNVSRATDALNSGGQTNYYQTVINQGSNYVWAVNDTSGAASNTSVNVVSSSNPKPTSYQFSHGTAGYSESTITLGELATAYNYFASPENITISLLMQGHPTGGTTVVNGFTVNNFNLANYLVQNISGERRDCVTFVSPDYQVVAGNKGLESSALVAWAGALESSSYLVVDSGYKYQYDRYNNVYRYVPLNGDIAGLCARTDQTNAPWWSPAGFNRGQINNVVRLAFNPAKPDRDLLYSNGIDPVVSFPGLGTYLYGDKTFLSNPSAFDRINVRRLFIVLETAISTAAKYSLFEFNDTFTRAQFVNMVTPYLRQVKGSRGITDFKVVCDDSNNPAQVIDSNQFVGDIYIKPARSINYIQLNFVAVGTGVDFSTVVGQYGSMVL